MYIELSLLVVGNVRHVGILIELSRDCGLVILAKAKHIMIILPKATIWNIFVISPKFKSYP